MPERIPPAKAPSGASRLRYLHWAWILLLTVACAPAIVPAPAAVMPTRVPTSVAPSPITTATPTTPPTPPPPTHTPTPQPTLTPTLPPDCPLPPSLMLHSAFGAERARALAEAILHHGLRTITYRDVLADLQSGRCPPTDAVLITLDDLGTDWLRPVFKEIIRAFTDRDLTLTVGVVAGHEPQNPAIWDYLRALDAQGVEIASHTLDHYNLPALKGEELQRQVQESYRHICEGVGRCPVSLILPFGNGADDPRVLAAAQDYVFIVGIQAPHRLIAPPPYVVGRIAPDNDDQDRTIRLLLNSFHP